MEDFFLKNRFKFTGSKVICIIAILLISSICQARTLIDNIEIDSIEVFVRSTEWFHTTGESLVPYEDFMDICKSRYLKQDHVWYESIKSKEIIYGFSQSMAKLETPSFMQKVFKRKTIKGGLFEKPLLCLKISYNNGVQKIFIFSENKQFCWFSNEAFLINLEVIAFVLNNIEFKMKGDLFLFYGIKKT